MTVLDALLSATPTLMTMTTNVVTTTTTSADQHGNINSAGATTMLSYTSTVLGNIDIPEKIIIVQDSLSYVEAIDDEQLNKLENLLLEKHINFGTNDKSEDIPKVYTIKRN